MRLLAIGEGLAPSGYARVMESLLTQLVDVFDVTLFAINAYEPHTATDSLPFDVRLNALAGDKYGREQLPGLLAALQPQLVLVHGDSIFYSIHRVALQEYRLGHPHARVVVYCPADWAQQPAAVAISLADVDLLVAYSHAGLATLERGFQREGLAPPPCAVIAHGVDVRSFYPLVEGDRAQSRALARARLFDEDSHLRDAFIVLNANRNQRRKRIDATLEAFAQLAREREDAYLYLHMGMRERGIDVPACARALGIEQRLLVTSDGDLQPHVDDEQLNQIYNACDVGVNTSLAEGFGLVALEHAAVGAPQLLAAHAACAEYWGEDALLLAVDDEGRVEPREVAAQLKRLATQPVWTAALGERGLALARASNRGWSAIAASWREALVRVTSEGSVLSRR